MTEFTDKYISQSEHDAKPDPDKVLLSNDAYALGTMLEKLMMVLGRSR
jgi:hypothetical protein